MLILWNRYLGACHLCTYLVAFWIIPKAWYHTVVLFLTGKLHVTHPHQPLSSQRSFVVRASTLVAPPLTSVTSVVDPAFPYSFLDSHNFVSMPSSVQSPVHIRHGFRHSQVSRVTKEKILRKKSLYYLCDQK